MLERGRGAGLGWKMGWIYLGGLTFKPDIGHLMDTTAHSKKQMFGGRRRSVAQVGLSGGHTMGL